MSGATPAFPLMQVAADALGSRPPIAARSKTFKTDVALVADVLLTGLTGEASNGPTHPRNLSATFHAFLGTPPWRCYGGYLAPIAFGRLTQCSWLGKGLWEPLRRATRVCCTAQGVGSKAVEVKPLSTTYGHVPNALLSATNSAHSKSRFCASPLPISLAPCSPLSRTLRAASGGGKRHPGQRLRAALCRSAGRDGGMAVFQSNRGMGQDSRELCQTMRMQI